MPGRAPVWEKESEFPTTPYSAYGSLGVQTGVPASRAQSSVSSPIARTLMKLETGRGQWPRLTANDPAHSFGPPRQGCGQSVDLFSAGEERGSTSYWAPGAGPRAGQNPATFVSFCVFPCFGWRPVGRFARKTRLRGELGVGVRL